MNQADDLCKLWKTQPVKAEMRGEEMQALVLKKTARFDRAIRRRNLREVVASIVGAIAFIYVFWGQTFWLSRMACFIILGSFAWIAYYLLKRGSGPEDPNPDQSAVGYYRALIRKVDYQIRMLRSVKYWYLMPMYIGLMLLSAGWILERHTAIRWRDATGPLIYTVIFVAIWWFNEVYGVGKLLELRMDLESGIEDLS